MATKRLALVCCSEESRAALTAAFRPDGARWDVLQPADVEFEAARLADYDGYVISGSVLSVVDDASTRTVSNVLDLIRRVHGHSSAPMLGICFGAQAIAAALGGRVGPNPGGRFRLGIETLEWSPSRDLSRWPETAQPAVVAQSHGECVLELPPVSTSIASSNCVPNEIFVVDDRFLGVQGHPEIDNRGLQEGFMAFHRPRFDARQWQAIVDEAQRPVASRAVVALGRRLLRDGHV